MGQTAGTRLRRSTSAQQVSTQGKNMAFAGIRGGRSHLVPTLILEKGASMDATAPYAVDIGHLSRSSSYRVKDCETSLVMDTNC